MTSGTLHLPAVSDRAPTPETDALCKQRNFTPYIEPASGQGTVASELARLARRFERERDAYKRELFVLACEGTAAPQVVAVLRELVELKAIKRKIEARTASDDERERYKFSKEKAWNDAEAWLHDSPISALPSSGTRNEIIEECAKAIEAASLTYAGPDPHVASDLRFLIVAAIRDLKSATTSAATEKQASPRRWRVKDEQGDDLIAVWKRRPRSSDEYAAAEIIEELERNLAAAWQNVHTINDAYCKLDVETRELRGSHFADAVGRALPATRHALPCNISASSAITQQDGHANCRDQRCIAAAACQSVTPGCFLGGSAPVAPTTALKLDKERVRRVAGAFFGTPYHVDLCEQAIGKALREAHLLIESATPSASTAPDDWAEQLDRAIGRGDALQAKLEEARREHDDLEARSAIARAQWVWWEKGDGYAVGPRDKGAVAIVFTIEEAQALCKEFNATPCGCVETYPQLVPGEVSHGPGCTHRVDMGKQNGR